MTISRKMTSRKEHVDQAEKPWDNPMTTLRFWTGKRQTSPASLLGKTSDVVLNTHTLLLDWNQTHWCTYTWTDSKFKSDMLVLLQQTHWLLHVLSHQRHQCSLWLTWNALTHMKTPKYSNRKMSWCTLIPDTLGIFCYTRCTDDYWHQTHPCIVALNKLVVGQGVLRLRQKHICDRSVAALLFYRHLSVQNTILMWSVLFLLPGSSYLEPVPCFCPPFYLCQLLKTFLENLSLFKNLFFSPIALICIWCVCMCVQVSVYVRACVCVCAFMLYACKECVSA